MTPKGYAALTRIIMDLARTHCSEKLAFTLEGGYHLTGLRDSVRAVVKELSRDSILTDDDITSFEKTSPPPIIEEVMAVQKKYWPKI